MPASFLPALAPSKLPSASERKRLRETHSMPVLGNQRGVLHSRQPPGGGTHPPAPPSNQVKLRAPLESQLLYMAARAPPRRPPIDPLAHRPIMPLQEHALAGRVRTSFAPADPAQRRAHARDAAQANLFSVGELDTRNALVSAEDLVGRRCRQAFQRRRRHRPPGGASRRGAPPPAAEPTPPPAQPRQAAPPPGAEGVAVVGSSPRLRPPPPMEPALEAFWITLPMPPPPLGPGAEEAGEEGRGEGDGGVGGGGGGGGGERTFSVPPLPSLRPLTQSDGLGLQELPRSPAHSGLWEPLPVARADGARRKESALASQMSPRAESWSRGVEAREELGGWDRQDSAR